MKALSTVTIIVNHRPKIALSFIFVATHSLPCKFKVSYSDKEKIRIVINNAVRDTGNVNQQEVNYLPMTGNCNLIGKSLRWVGALPAAPSRNRIMWGLVHLGLQALIYIRKSCLGGQQAFKSVTTL